MKKIYLHTVGVCIVLAGCFMLYLSGCTVPGGSSGNNTSDSGSTDYICVKVYLGRGYDVFDRYADPQYIRSTILDFDKLSSAGVIEKTLLNKTAYTTYSGTSLSDYQRDLGSKVSVSGSYSYFSGSVKTSFSSSTYQSSANQYGTIQTEVEKTMYTIADRTDYNSLETYLSDNFKSDLADTSVTPDNLFVKYGTHVMTGIILGGRYDYNLAAAQNTSSGSYSISAYVQAKYESAFASVAASTGFTYDTAVTTAYTTKEVSATTVGGTSTNLATDEALSEWIGSITDDTVVFMDYAENGLVPIWELCSDATRASAIKTAYDSWAVTKYKSYLSGTASNAVVDIQVKLSDCGDFYTDGGFTYDKINLNFNKNTPKSGSAQVYMYVAYGADDGSDGKYPITELGFVMSSDSAADAKTDAGSAYTLIDTDFNEKAGGYYIYLVYLRSSSGTPVRELYAYDKEDAKQVFPYGSTSTTTSYTFTSCKRMEDGAFTTDEVDMNKGAKGDTLNLYYGTK